MERPDPNEFPRVKKFGDWLWVGDGHPVIGLVFIWLVLLVMVPVGLLFYGVVWLWLTLTGRSTANLTDAMRDPKRRNRS